MKFILVPVLISLLFAQTFSKWMVVLEYKLNKDFIAKNLCINKAKPVLKCKGKCQMMKKLAEEEKQNTSAPAGSKHKVQENVFTDQINKPELLRFHVGNTSYNESPVASHIAPYFPSAFHPPAVA